MFDARIHKIHGMRVVYRFGPEDFLEVMASTDWKLALTSGQFWLGMHRADPYLLSINLLGGPSIHYSDPDDFLLGCWAVSTARRERTHLNEPFPFAQEMRGIYCIRFGDVNPADAVDLRVLSS